MPPNHQHKTCVKICGVHDVATALHAASAGADAIGLVFYPPSPRYVEMDVAKRIAASLPAEVDSVALLVNAEPAFIREVIAVVRPNILQFHGDEDAGFCAQFGVPYWKAIRVNPSTDLLKLRVEFASAERLLLDADKDADKTGLYGGSGETFDWQLIPDSMRADIILSGGLKPENVAAAIRAVRPWAVDVSSGVESSKGVKSLSRITEFIEAVKRADIDQ